MIRKTILIMLVAMLLSSTVALAAPAGWEYVTENDNCIFYINPSTMLRNSDWSMIHGWVMVEYKDKDYSIAVAKFHEFFKPWSRQWGITTGASYDSRGNLITSVNNLRPWSEVIPDSITESIMLSAMAAIAKREVPTR